MRILFSSLLPHDNSKVYPRAVSSPMNQLIGQTVSVMSRFAVSFVMTTQNQMSELVVQMKGQSNSSAIPMAITELQQTAHGGSVSRAMLR